MRNFFAIAASTLVLSACASAPQKSAQEAVAKPAYTEKVGAIGVEQMKVSTACPADKASEKAEWRQVVAMASSCVKAKDFGKVETLGDWLATHASTTPWGAYYLSLAASNKKNYPRAQWMLELAMKKAPGEALLHYELGRLHWQLGAEDAALKSLKTAAELNPGLADAHLIIGQVALMKEDFPEARRCLEKALAANPKDSGALMAAASVEIKTANFEKAEQLLVQAIGLSPRSSKARYALASVRELNLKKIPDALQTYRELKQLSEARKLDENLGVSLDEKIKSLEKQVSQVNKGSQVGERQPSAQKGS
jgi:tetratricopeptide (TPR) repeat protein